MGSPLGHMVQAPGGKGHPQYGPMDCNPLQFKSVDANRSAKIFKSLQLLIGNDPRDSVRLRYMGVNVGSKHSEQAGTEVPEEDDEFVDKVLLVSLTMVKLRMVILRVGRGQPH